MDKIRNNLMSEYTTEKQVFRNITNTVFTTEVDDLYVVYSYGTHFPIYVYDHGVELWFGNVDKYSPTTSKHQTMSRPDAEEIHMLSTEELSALVRLGSYGEFCSERCVTDRAMYYKSTGYTNFNQGRA